MQKQEVSHNQMFFSVYLQVVQPENTAASAAPENCNICSSWTVNFVRISVPGFPI